MVDFLAVQCCDCQRYQVTQKRKDGKMTCKVCGKKQSVRKVFGRSQRAADVRKAVQRLNMVRGEAEELFEDRKIDEQENHKENDREEQVELVPTEESRWNIYANAEQESQDEDEVDEFVTALPDRYAERKGKRKWQRVGGSHKRRSREGDAQSGFESARKAIESSRDPLPCANAVDDGAECLQNGRHAKGIRSKMPDRNRSVNTAQPRGSRVTPSRWEAVHDDGSVNSRRKPSTSRWDTVQPATHTSHLSDGLQTTLGVDAVVNDEVFF